MISTNHRTTNDKTILTAKEMWGEGAEEKPYTKNGPFYTRSP
jgi:hypothetical protein